MGRTRRGYYGLFIYSLYSILDVVIRQYVFFKFVEKVFNSWTLDLDIETRFNWQPGNRCWSSGVAPGERSGRSGEAVRLLGEMISLGRWYAKCSGMRSDMKL